jgi:hypothetical protein
MINASEGFRLEVHSGCLWLTRPGDAVDHFLVAGSSIALHENQVLIQGDRHPGLTTLEAARYRLIPLTPHDKAHRFAQCANIVVAIARFPLGNLVRSPDAR